jgi:hypothetical protein
VLVTLLWLFTLMGCTSCSTPMESVPGHTMRIGQPEITEGKELDLKIFTNEAECLGSGVSPDEVNLCTPWMDRSTGQVRLGFQFRLESEPFPLPVWKEHVDVLHDGATVLDNEGVMRVQVIPHGPNRANQIFILVIDGSASMMNVDSDGEQRIEKVREALLMPEVVERFFPGDGIKTGVVLMTFTNGTPQPVGGKIEVIKSAGKYRKVVRDQLGVRGGYTHLYDAVRDSTGILLDNKEIRYHLDLWQAEPTVVVLTDGFNNQAYDDTCGSNAPRLSMLLKHLDNVRRGDNVDIRSRPSVYAVGLGRPLRRKTKVLEAVDEKVKDVKPRKLCGGKFVNERIDGGLERVGIDNASLQWMATHGGGFAFVRQDSEGIGKAFAEAAATRYDWFELRYQVDPAYLRREFETTLRLRTFASAEAKVKLFPSGWMDPPTGVVDEDGWAQPAPKRSILASIMPVLGLLAGMVFLSAGLVNTRRALFGRVGRPKGP